MKKFSKIITYDFLGMPLSYSARLKKLRWGNEDVSLDDAQVRYLNENIGILNAIRMFDRIKEKNGVTT